jgi:phosphohistidine phosphatase
MTRELMILRHAKSDWASEAESDFERPLSGRGKREAPRVGDWLRHASLAPDRVVSSPARRARQTATAVCKVLGVPKGAITWEPAIYEASREALLGVLANCPPEAARVLLIGHNPGLDELLEYLCGEPPSLTEDGKRLTTAALARLAMPADWQGPLAGAATLLTLLRPRDIT